MLNIYMEWKDASRISEFNLHQCYEQLPKHALFKNDTVYTNQDMTDIKPEVN